MLTIVYPLHWLKLNESGRKEKILFIATGYKMKPCIDASKTMLGLGYLPPKSNSYFRTLRKTHGRTIQVRNNFFLSTATSSAPSAPSSALAWHLLADNSSDVDSVGSESRRSATSVPAPLPPPPDTSSVGNILPYLLKLMFGEKQLLWRIGLSISLMFVSKIAGLACPFFIKLAVDTLTVNPSAGQEGIAQLLHFPLLPALSVTPAVQGALFAVACFGFCDMIKNVAKEMQAPTFLPVTQAVSRRVSYHTFAHLLNLDVSFHLENRTGRMSRILERGPRSIQQIFRAVVFIFLPTAFELLAVCTVLTKTFNPLVGALVGLTFVLYISWSVTLTQMAAEVRKQVIDLDNQTTSKAIDALQNFETVILFNNHKLEVGQYFNLVKGLQGATNKTEQLAAMLNAGQAVILAMGMASIMFAAVLVGRSGAGATPGDLVMIQGLLLQLWAPLQFLGWLYRELKNSMIDIEEFMDILRTRSRISGGQDSMPELVAGVAADHSMVPVNHNGGASHNGEASEKISQGLNGRSADGIKMVPSTSGRAPVASGLDIQLQSVVFGYSHDRKILRGLSLRVEPGQSVAIVGPSGSGKSTILKMLTRQYDVTEGSLYLNGCEIKELSLDSLRNNVAVVPQETVLFNDSILENIRYGRPSASDDDVFEAAKMARLDVAVGRMTNGFNTVVGERGLKLSGGEKQRVAIARAFLRAPRLLICDEATSALDSETEAQIMASLNELALGRTSIFVAHRLSTVKGCDKIIVLDEGQVVEQGSHEALMKQEKGVYRSMWELQAAEEEQQHQQQHNLYPGMTVEDAPLDADILGGKRGNQHIKAGQASSDEESVVFGAVRRKSVV
ncbi:hypothetical protein CEUSTIGMA_g78.t1 [Chlamydomonas eustigma]|uniref:ABC transporter domain-containing protein n=1 Tax=Chlamydomonas eustigma TaxID=1157962 RepID=A0A250WPN6_9CHLO|nr:hypothetical protein CEUSTIGMA_g78.t1 [Chlamydomonas eustigma]|eukprot:GAX72622.1 hypothetical protein CEUSTIGMA_g78.t1 [Chlamydomonas eustigma]